MDRLRKELGDHDQWVDKPPRSVTKPGKQGADTHVRRVLDSAFART